MRIVITVFLMLVWSAFIYWVIDALGEVSGAPDRLSLPAGLGWNLLTSILLLIGLIGNVWIFFTVARESVWKWKK